jgi:choline dehydrogenase
MGLLSGGMQTGPQGTDPVLTPAVAPFANHLPVRVLFGEGRALELVALLREIGASDVLLLVDRDIETHNPEVAALLASLEASDLTVTRMEKEPGEPTIAMVDEATGRMGAGDVTAVVAIGGGSVIDTAKAARLCHQLGCTFAGFLGSQRAYPPPRIPLLAVPTTAGTGSEVSGGAVVCDPASGRKAGIAHPHLRPQYAVVDPRLTWSMPPGMTANTGVDALAQAVAATVAKVRTPSVTPSHSRRCG